jgi:hypothetical protein
MLQGHKELWSRKHGITGFSAQLICLLNADLVFVSDPLDGGTHDATAFRDTPAEEIVDKSGGGIADKGYQGTGMITPKKKPRGGELADSDKEYNTQVSSLRAPVEQVIGHFKAWRIFHTDYRRSYRTYRNAFDAARGLFFFSIIWSSE